jgi:glycosyltransferase involved in cell wall biosynthesis
VLVDAWRESGLNASAAALVLVGAGTGPPRIPAGGAVAFVGPQPPDQVRNFLAAADVCVIPSIRTRGFREPWGLVANEAMNQSTPVIASEEVGAVAGGLVRHERNGLVVPAGDVPALAHALRRLHDDPALRTELGANARRDVAAYTFEAWAAGFEGALDSVRRR